jgi:hypothetical protein
MGTIEATVQDKDGKVLESRNFKMDSWVDNFAWLFHLIVNMVFGTVWPKITAGTHPTTVYWTYSSVPGISGQTDGGIVIGTGNTAYDHTHVALETQIAHGSGSGQVLYSPEVPTDPVWSSTKWTMTKQRVFNNVSGASISVKEIGIYAKENGSGSSLMMARDVVAPISVPHLGTLTVTYSFEIVA